MKKHFVEILITLLIICITSGVLLIINKIQTYCLATPNGQVIMISGVIIISSIFVKTIFFGKE